uniref:IS701 family transposase n=1 Tax=Pectobacterium cacticida TaxID=69221 RepID=UPI0039886C0D
PCGWVTGDEIYGRDRRLRVWLESREQPFVLAVARNEPLCWQGPEYMEAQDIANALRPQSYKRLSAGQGTKGERLYDWVLAPLWRLQLTAEERRWGHYLLVRRSRDDRRERAYYVVYAPRAKGRLSNLVKVAGRRWEIEIGFEAAKGECGLDHYEVRRWQGWYRHITLSLLAHAVLVAVREQEKKNVSTSRTGCPERTGVTQVVIDACLAREPHGCPCYALVRLAAQTSVSSAAIPLRTAGLCSAHLLNTAVVLS